jgi:hypothetical protein
MTEIREFQFDVMIRLPKGSPDIEDLVDRLYEAGCDDAVVGCGNPGMLGLAFVRVGSDREAVIAGAVNDALAGLPQSAVVEGVNLSVSGLDAECRDRFC